MFQLYIPQWLHIPKYKNLGRGPCPHTNSAFYIPYNAFPIHNHPPAASAPIHPRLVYPNNRPLKVNWLYLFIRVWFDSPSMQSGNTGRQGVTKPLYRGGLGDEWEMFLSCRKNDLCNNTYRVNLEFISWQRNLRGLFCAKRQ